MPDHIYPPVESADRKATPITTGVLDYFPAAIAEVARVSKAGNDKHNPGEPMHHARGKSTDHADSIARHLMQRGGVDEETGVRHSAELAWRALALLQQELEDEGLAPLARGARLPDGERAQTASEALRQEIIDAVWATIFKDEFKEYALPSDRPEDIFDAADKLAANEGFLPTGVVRTAIRRLRKEKLS